MSADNENKVDELGALTPREREALKGYVQWKRDNHMRMNIRDRANAIVIKATGRTVYGPRSMRANDNGPPCKRCGKPCGLFAEKPWGYICKGCDQCANCGAMLTGRRHRCKPRQR